MTFISTCMGYYYHPWLPCCAYCIYCLQPPSVLYNYEPKTPVDHLTLPDNGFFFVRTESDLLLMQENNAVISQSSSSSSLSLLPSLYLASHQHREDINSVFFRFVLCFVFWFGLYLVLVSAKYFLRWTFYAIPDRRWSHGHCLQKE